MDDDKQDDAKRVHRIEQLIAAGVLEIADLVAWERADVTHIMHAYYVAKKEKQGNTV